MKYKYLELFGENITVRSLKNFDKDYEKDWKNMNSQINKREQALDEAERARKETELKTAEAKRRTPTPR